jgi:hypothetical protein
MAITASERRLKQLMKEAVRETLSEQPELLRPAVEEALEDLALLRAMEQGETGRLVSRQAIFKLLDGKR